MNVPFNGLIEINDLTLTLTLMNVQQFLFVIRKRSTYIIDKSALVKLKN